MKVSNALSIFLLALLFATANFCDYDFYRDYDFYQDDEDKAAASEDIGGANDEETSSKDEEMTFSTDGETKFLTDKERHSFTEKEPDEFQDDVVVLTEDNFTVVVVPTKIVLVNFYAPWCLGCQKLAPEYAAAARELKKKYSEIILAKVDVTMAEKLVKRYGVTAYPTLILFERGERFLYAGREDEAGIVEYMQTEATRVRNTEEMPGAVLDLTLANFTDTVFRNELMLVQFYDPRCKSCAAKLTHFKLAALELKEKNEPVVLAKVNAAAEKVLAKMYGVKRYPTPIIFRKGRPFEYKGPWDVQGMVPFMTGQLGDPAKPVDGLAEMRNVKENVTILGVFDKTSDPRYQTFQNALQSIREDHGLFYTTDEAVMKRYDANAGTVLVLNAERYYTEFEPKWHGFNMKEDTKPEEIEDFIKKHEFPLVGSFDSDKDRYSKRSPLCLMFYTVDWSVHHREATQLWRRKLAAIAKDYLDITFAIADEDLNSQLFRDFGLVESGEDINLGIVADGKKYPIKPMEEYDEDHIREFLDQFKRGELQPRVRSQPIPKKQQGPVTVVVAKTFDKIVRDPTKDVFISLYDPSCQKSRELEPTLNKLARRFRSVKNFVIAEMDGKANDIPTGYEVNTFPAFFFSPTDSKDKPLRYDGEREVGDFIQFLKDQASVSLDSLKCDDLGDSLTDEPNVSLDSAKGEASVSFDSLRDEASVSFDSSKSEPSVSLGSLKCEASVPSDCFRDGAYVLGSLKDEASVSLDSAKGEANVSLDSTKGEANVSLDSLKDREASASFDSSKGKPSASLDSSKGEASVSSGRFEDEAYVLGSLKDESVVEERDLRTMN